MDALEKVHVTPHTRFWLWDDFSEDGTLEILNKANLQNKIVISNKHNMGLRNILINFFSDFRIKNSNVDFIAKMDNDCVAPENWLFDILEIFEKSDPDILSPNVIPSNAAYKLGEDDTEGKGYRRASTVGGLWVMKAGMIDDINFEQHDILGIKGAYNLLYQIMINKDPVVGWVPSVEVQDIGHYSGMHPLHIKSEEHAEYSREVGRGTAW
jgi:glycosyltransferase involved in cell wall biosynthesis